MLSEFSVSIFPFFCISIQQRVLGKPLKLETNLEQTLLFHWMKASYKGICDLFSFLSEMLRWHCSVCHGGENGFHSSAIAIIFCKMRKIRLINMCWKNKMIFELAVNKDNDDTDDGQWKQIQRLKQRKWKAETTVVL